MDELLEKIADLLDTSVIVPFAEYDEKTIAEHERDTLLRLIISDFDLNYDGSDLRTYGELTRAYIKAVYPKRYAARFNELNAQRNEKNADKPAD